MVVKKGKSIKQMDTYNKNTSESASTKNTLSSAFLDELKGAFDNFAKIPEPHRIQLYGDQKYLDQFWTYFQKEHPNLLDKIDKKDLPVYIQAIENKGFSLTNITNNTGKLHEEFKPEDTEIHVIEKSLSALKKFCEDKINTIPDDAFKKFAKITGFTHDTLELSSDGNIKNIDDLPVLWKKFLEKESISLGTTSAEHAERLLTPNYNPTERIMVTVALTKIRKECKGTLRTAFDAKFSLPVTIFDSYQDLLNFKTEWLQFLDDHASEVDKSLAKKFDDIIVTNGDIYNELLKSGRKFDDSKGFSEWEQYFRRIFNALATHQLFDEVQKTQETIDHYITTMGNTFKQFPPYVNDILNIYPFNDKNISLVDTSFHTDLEYIDIQISDNNNQYAVANDEERKLLREKIKILKQEREQRRWQAYISFLRTKDVALADVFADLVASTFDFSVLSVDHQQLLLDILIKNKLEDSIKNKVPELLDVKEDELTQFVHDLFDLKKMDLTLPTRHGPVPLSFVKKEFLASARTQLPALNDLEDIQNLPLNFVTQLTESNAAFFEESPIFNSIYTDFVARNGTFRFNDAYKVRIRKEGKIVEGYLSAYAPIEENNVESYTGKELYLYSHPISAPNQERELVTWKDTNGRDSTNPVVIKDSEQSSCDMEILDKKLNLNGDAFGALLFGYVLGQQSINTNMSPEKEKALAEKLGTLQTYKEKELGEENEILPVVPSTESSDKNIETDQDKFLNEWKQLKGNVASEFVVGSRLYIPFASSEVPPQEAGNAWLSMEITHINTANGTFKVRFYGGELSLGKSEGVSKELSMNISTFASIKKAFGNDMYRLSDMKGASFEQQMDVINQSSVAKKLENHFGSLKFEGGKFIYSLGNYVGKEVTHFGVYEPKAMNESVDKESGILILYKIHPNANGTITVSGDSTAGNYAKNYPTRDMDYVNFMLFVKEKGLQPKCKDQIQAINAKVVAEKEETPTTVHGFSLNNVMSFFKNGVSKIKDGIKKHDDERTEEITDILTNQGQLWSNIGGFLSPFGRMSGAFENMGMEAFLDRDNRVWKKVEKWTKFYEDFDYTKIYEMYIKPMLEGKIKIVPHYKIAALLLVHLKKGKGPYAKFPQTTATGNRIGSLLGKDHQARYLAIREKRIRDLEENAHIYGGAWADQVKNELVELEMRYIVHVMDGRHMGMGDEVKYYFQDKYSKKFCDELEGAYVPFFKQSTVEEGFTKNQEVNFEFARFEYFRQLADRPQQALPHLKVMATKAINDKQWEVFDAAVLTGLLSGVFLNMTYASTQSFIQKICRTRGFIPGLFAKDIKQQSKMQRLLDLFSGGDFTSTTKYNAADYSYRVNKGPGNFINTLVDSKKPGKGRMELPGRMHDLSAFLSLTGKNKDNKTLLDLLADPTLALSDKLLLQEYIDKTKEQHESLDPQVQENTYSLTGSILTKSQSVVDPMIRIDTNGFAGKDGDAIQNMEAFSDNMKEAIPKEPLTSPEQVKFFVQKFFNRFGDRGFSGNDMTAFLRRLKWCNDHPGHPDVDDVLYYSVVGKVVKSLTSGQSNPPAQLLGALGAWQTFFKNNLTTFLQPDLVASCCGSPQYWVDCNKTTKLESRDVASVLLDPQESQFYLNRLPREQRDAVSRKRTEIKGTSYINVGLYQLADDLAKRCGIANKFYRNPKDTLPTTSPSASKNTGAKIRNAAVIEKVRRILEGKQPEEEDSDDYFNPYSDPYDI